MTIQVKPVYRKPEEGQGQPGRVLDKDDTQRLLIKARSSVLHMEAGYTTDNLLLPSKLMPCNEGGDHIRPSQANSERPPPGTSSTSSMKGFGLSSTGSTTLPAQVQALRGCAKPGTADELVLVPPRQALHAFSGNVEHQLDEGFRVVEHRLDDTARPSPGVARVRKTGHRGRAGVRPSQASSERPPPGPSSTSSMKGFGLSSTGSTN